MLKIAIVDPPAPDWMINPMPLLGPAILKTFLESKGYPVETVDLAVRVRYLNRYPLRKIFNLNLFDVGERLINFLETGKDEEMEYELEKMIKLGRLSDYNVIGFNFIPVNIRFALCLAKVLKEKYNKTILFGSAVTSRTDFTDVLDLGFIDFLIVGDGEEAFLRVLHYLEGKDDLENCSGLTYKKDGKIHTNEPNNPPIEEKPIPSFNPDDLRLHKKLSTIGLSILPYLFSRGCRFKCAFCFEYKNTFFTYQPIDKVISDIKFLLKTYGANAIFFAEGNLNNNPAYVREFSERVLKENMKFYWGGFATIAGLDEETIKLMAKSGCKYLFVGVESGSEAMSAKMNLLKKKDVEKFKEILSLLHKYGIGTHNFFIVEFPYETYDDFKKTLTLIKETGKYTTTANTYPFQVLESSVVSIAPTGFQLKVRKKKKYDYLFEDGREFDEIKGLKWEEKSQRGMFKQRIARNVIFRHRELNILFRSLLKSPLYGLKRKMTHPYATLDDYFM